VATILVIDDSPTHRAEILRALEAAAMFDRVVEAHDGLRGLKLLLAEPVDVVLCDLEMPGLDGEKLLAMKQSKTQIREVPFIFLTASQNYERRARLLERGANDAVIKPFHPGELIARLRMHLETKRLHDELRDKNAMLARLSTTDGLTGLRTRRYASETLSVELLRARRYGAPLSLLMADLDHFKRVNDEFGHPVGDAVLRGVSRLLLDQLRVTDVAGRYGGEEIVVVLAQNGLDGACTLAERWRSQVEGARFDTPDGSKLEVTLSIGAAEFSKQMETPDDLVAAADAALYQAKKSGRNRVVAAREGQEERSQPGGCGPG